MTNVIGTIRRRLQRAGWSIRDARVITLDGSELWLVSAKRNRQGFSARGTSRREAWKGAWSLAKQIHGTAERRPLIVPFPQLTAVVRRAG